jgi:hypothetical protein
MPDFTAFLVLAVPVAVGVTKAVDLVRNAIDPNDAIPKVVWNIVAFGFGIGAALAWGINLTAAAGLSISNGVAGEILTGAALGGMAGFFHEALDAWSAKGHQPPGP